MMTTIVMLIMMTTTMAMLMLMMTITVIETMLLLMPIITHGIGDFQHDGHHTAGDADAIDGYNHAIDDDDDFNGSG